jgi:hypothetical protein
VLVFFLGYVNYDCVDVDIRVDNYVVVDVDVVKSSKAQLVTDMENLEC